MKPLIIPGENRLTKRLLHVSSAILSRYTFLSSPRVASPLSLPSRFLYHKRLARNTSGVHALHCAVSLCMVFVLSTRTPACACTASADEFRKYHIFNRPHPPQRSPPPPVNGSFYALLDYTQYVLAWLETVPIKPKRLKSGSLYPPVSSSQTASKLYLFNNIGEQFVASCCCVFRDVSNQHLISKNTL